MKKAAANTKKKKKATQFDLRLDPNHKLTKEQKAHLKKSFKVFADGASLVLGIKPIVATYNENPGG